MKRKIIYILCGILVVCIAIVLVSFRTQIRYFVLNHTSYPVCFTEIGIALGDDGPEIRLVEACRNSDVYTVVRLLEAGADPNYSYDGYYTAIEAVYSNPEILGRQSMAEVLVRYGADVTKYSVKEEAVFTEAGYLLQRDPAEETIIVNNIEFLLNNGASFVNPSNGVSLLHIAAEADSVPLAKLLIEEFGYAHDVECDGATPMDVAASMGSMDVIAYLQGIESEERCIQCKTKK